MVSVGVKEWQFGWLIEDDCLSGAADKWQHEVHDD